MYEYVKNVQCAVSHTSLLLSGFPCLCYGLASWALVKHHEDVVTDLGVVRIYFMMKEDKNAQY